MEINYAENQWNCYTDFIVSTHESTSSYNKWSNIFWWSKVSCISDGDSLCRCGISASECIVQPLGLLKNDRMEKLVDYVTWIICGLLMVLTVAARIRL